MLAVVEALAVVLQHARPLSPETQPLTPTLLGRVLAEPVVSDIDSPPFDKSLMDGYAVRSADLTGPPAVLHVIEEITAGVVPTKAVGPGQAVRVMTGAPMPIGADAVVMVERTKSLADDRVEIEGAVRAGQNVFPRGRELRRGQIVLGPGQRLRPQEFGALASVGRTAVSVHPAPVVGVLATGDELVEAAIVPGPGQIRNSNGPMLSALVARAGGVPRYLGIAPDRRPALRDLIGRALSAPVCVLAGGVSAGKLDLVPGVLHDLGVAPHFHKVALKPGKPIFFGTHNESLVFGLPGNPVSAFVGFELFVRPALRRLRGEREAARPAVLLPLAEAFACNNDRPTYHPAAMEVGPVGWWVRPLPWAGSPDLLALTRADALLELPAGAQQFAAGESVPVQILDWDGLVPV